MKYGHLVRDPPPGGVGSNNKSTVPNFKKSFCENYARTSSPTYQINAKQINAKRKPIKAKRKSINMKWKPINVKRKPINAQRKPINAKQKLINAKPINAK